MGFPTRAWSGPASAVARKQSPRLLSEVSSLSKSWKRGSAPWEAGKEQKGFRACFLLQHLDSPWYPELLQCKDLGVRGPPPSQKSLHPPHVPLPRSPPPTAQHLFEGEKAKGKPQSLTIGVHVVSGHLRWGEPLSEGVGAVDALLHAQQLLGWGQSSVGVQHPLQTHAATAVRLGWKRRANRWCSLAAAFWGAQLPWEAWRGLGNRETLSEGRVGCERGT